VTSIALSLPDPQNHYWLFDAGEGTQHRMLGSRFKLNKLERIFVTHLHGDHSYGLPGLLSSRTYFDGAVPLQVYGPPGIRAFIDCAMDTSATHLNYELEVLEIEEGLIFEDDRFTVFAAQLEHRISCFGYRIVEHPKLGKLDMEALQRHGVPPGPLFGRLQKGEDIILPSGQKICPTDVREPAGRGRIVTIIGDTCPCENTITLARDADLLVHEGTFAPGFEEKAALYGHSTILQAAEIAAKANAKRLVLTHFSSRYGEEDLEQYVQDVKPTFSNVLAAKDFFEVVVEKP
jgi:ribonuclease Z